MLIGEGALDGELYSDTACMPFVMPCHQTRCPRRQEGIWDMRKEAIAPIQRGSFNGPLDDRRLLLCLKLALRGAFQQCKDLLQH